MPLNPGRYDQLVTIERAMRSRNEYGEDAIDAWAIVAEVWAHVILPNARDLSKEVASAGRPATDRTCTFKLRRPADVEEGDRIVWEGEAYGVEGFFADRRRGELTVTGRFLSGTDGR